MQPKKILLVALMLTMLMSVCVGCSKENPENYQKIDSEDTIQYNTDDSIDPNNYTTYVNKEINLVMNILTSNILAGDNIEKGKYIVSDVIVNLENDLDMVAEAIESVELLNPPTDYDDDRESILIRLVNAQGSLEAFYEILCSDDLAGLREAINLMEGELAALSGSFNVMWE